MTQKKKAAGGRPSKYKPEFAEQAKHLCRLGATTAQLAEAFGATPKTIENWMDKYPEFLRTVKDCKDDFDNQVIKSLQHRAIGYEHPHDHISNYQGDITITPTIKHYAPDTTACIFWLQNRQPEHFYPRKAVEENPTDPGNKADALLKAIADRLPD